MALSKEEEARGEALPAYSEFESPSTSAPSQPEASASTSTPTSAQASAPAPTNGPTLASPFNFPPDSDLPAYSNSSTSSSSTPLAHKPLAIPQVTPDPKAPFLDAYSEDLLLRRGVTRETWSAFLRTLSGFLAATVSDQAVHHAARVARRVPQRFGRETLAHARSTGQAIAEAARRGEYARAGVRAFLGGAVALPVATAVRAIGAAVSLPFAVAEVRPRTPRQRADAYALAANGEWLGRRGLEARLLDTGELAAALGLDAPEMLMALAAEAKSASAAARMAALGARVAELEVRTPADLELGAGTLWLVVTRKSEDGESDWDSESGKGEGKGKGGAW